MNYLAAVLTDALFAVFAFLIGLHGGDHLGRTEACQSVGAEWVVDKCMRVTRLEDK